MCCEGYEDMLVRPQLHLVTEIVGIVLHDVMALGNDSQTLRRSLSGLNCNSCSALHSSLWLLLEYLTPVFTIMQRIFRHVFLQSD